MKDDPDILQARLERLLKLAELAQYAPPEDRARIERSIQLIGQAIQAIARAREAMQQAVLLKQEAEANTVFRRSEQAALLAELRIISNRTR